MFRPTHIFFDLDHTLWDYDTNAEETIRELLVSYRPLIGAEMPFDVFYPIYLGHNHRLWERYRKNEIDNLTLRYQRWEDAFHDLGVARAEWMRQIGEDFLAICPRKKALLPNAVEVLDDRRELSFAPDYQWICTDSGCEARVLRPEGLLRCDHDPGCLRLQEAPSTNLP
ncbi:MAG: hypothetical protein U0176_19845 [Bacteroidia bacterium]